MERNNSDATIATLPDVIGKVFWRNATMVKGDKGMVVKSYDVIPKEL